MTRLALVALIALVFAACSSSRPAGRVNQGVSGCGTVIPENQFNRQRMAGMFTAVCRTGEVKVRINGCALSGKREFTVPAGPQELQVAFMDHETPDEEKVLTTQAVRMPLNVQAGRTYGVRGRATWRGGVPTVQLWIVDGSTGQTLHSVTVPQQNVSVDYPDFI